MRYLFIRVPTNWFRLESLSPKLIYFPSTRHIHLVPKSPMCRLTLINSIGQTHVASMAPAMQPAAIGRRGLFCFGGWAAISFLRFGGSVLVLKYGFLPAIQCKSHLNLSPSVAQHKPKCRRCSKSSAGRRFDFILLCLLCLGYRFGCECCVLTRAVR